jgi:DNA-binding NarL/FixJ family response regulator
MERAEKVAFGGPDSGLRPPLGLAVQRLENGSPGGLVLSFPLPSAARASTSLTPAERGVGSDLLLGFTNQEIARRRRVSVRTIANQIGGLFRKLNVHSRLELALCLAPDALQLEAGPCPTNRTG